MEFLPQAHSLTKTRGATVVPGVINTKPVQAPIIQRERESERCAERAGASEIGAGT